MSPSYAEFLAGKRRRAADAGPPCQPGDLPGWLFPFQQHIAAWAVRKGRAAVWADTGLGKTRMQLAWCAQVTRGGGKALILAPLAVAGQTAREGAAVGVEVACARDQAEADRAPGRVVVTNYERLRLFDPGAYAAVVLDESSILKSFSGATKRALVAAFAGTPHRLACTATPAPNDLEELCNHADFLGVMPPAEMRSTFFIADSRGEFGPGARPMELGWATSIAQQCARAGVPVFVKQLGATAGGRRHHDIGAFPPQLRVREYPAAAS